KEFGDRPTPLEFDVDSLRYDVGMFALSALGTGIFLFVNTLVGGLLTLAIPLLAAVVKERQSGELKAQAKRDGAEAIVQASRAVAPKFAEIVETFRERLIDFVITAGDALYCGIGELLDRTLEERRRS